MVLVSNDIRKLSACISVFKSVLNPFQWIFPVVYSLPEEFDFIFDSPVPVLVGINLPTNDFLNFYVSKFIKKTIQESDLIFVFLDQGFTFARNRVIRSIKVPHAHGFLSHFRSVYGSINEKKS